MSTVEAEYRARMDALTASQRIERSMAMLQWTRELLSRQVVAESGAMSDERLRWEVALRLYKSDPTTRSMIEQRLANVSG